MKLKYVLLVILLLTETRSTSQNAPIHYQGTVVDSVDIQKLLRQTREVYLRQQYDSVILLSDQILQKSTDIGFDRGAGESYFLKARATNRLGRRERAIEIYQLAVEQFDKVGDHSRMSSAYNNWGLVLKDMGRFREAIDIGEKALDHVRMKPRGRLHFHILNNLGNSYQNLAQFKNASRAYFEALQVLKNEPDSLYMQRMQAEIYINLGLAYFEQKLYKESQEIYMKSLRILEDNNEEAQLATIYNNLGILFTATEDLERATYFLKQAHQLCLNLNHKIEANVCKSNLGKVYLVQKDFDKAISTYKQAISDFKKFRAPAYLPSAYLGLGETLSKAGFTDRAEISFLKGLQIALKSGQKIKELKIYEGLIAHHKLVGELEMALMYYDLYSALSHELNDQQIGRLIGQLELSELLSKRDQALKTLESEAAFLQFKLNQRNMLLIMSGALIALVSLLFTLLFQQYRLKTENRSIALEQKILRAQLNPHFIFNALGAIQHYMIDHRPEKAASYLSKFSKLMRAILEGSRSGKTPLSVELENIRNYLDLQALRFSKPFEYSIEIDDHIDPKQVHIPPLLVQPLLENAIEHGLLPNQGGELVVRFKRNDPFILVEIQDDGIGIARRSNVDSVQPNKSGLGNIIVNERLMLLNRKIQKKMRLNISNRSNLDQNNHGTIASFMIPITP